MAEVLHGPKRGEAAPQAGKAASILLSFGALDGTAWERAAAQTVHDVASAITKFDYNANKWVTHLSLLANMWSRVHHRLVWFSASSARENRKREHLVLSSHRQKM